MPSFKKCTELHDTFISNQSAMASLASRMKAEILQEMRAGNPRAGKGDRNRSGGKTPGKASSNGQSGGSSETDRAGGNKPTDKKKEKKRKEGASAWPDMPKLKKEDYTSFRKEVSEAFPDGCIFFLASRCSRGDECQRPHEVPEGYEAIKARFATQ